MRYSFATKRLPTKARPEFPDRCVSCGHEVEVPGCCSSCAKPRFAPRAGAERDLDESALAALFDRYAELAS